MNDCKCEVAGSTAFRMVSFGLRCPLCGKPEPVSETDPKLKVNAQPLIQQNLIKGCDHIISGEIPEPKISYWEWFTHCPKCGEKL